ncbi:MAG TPA: hypothetical protein VM223_13860 [Planctomycetota bacterium]|nr:hypothetical protein [Planctomycetota bacterium]
MTNDIPYGNLPVGDWLRYRHELKEGNLSFQGKVLVPGWIATPHSRA